jgi:hypothetical protein
MYDLIMHTSEEWMQLFDDSFAMIQDPDGWDRKNFQYSWYEEKITLDEFKQRMMNSTIVPKGWNK